MDTDDRDRGKNEFPSAVQGGSHTCSDVLRRSFLSGTNGKIYAQQTKLKSNYMLYGVSFLLLIDFVRE